MKVIPSTHYVFVFRWYNQIKSYSGAESKKFPGVKDASKYMAAGGAAPAGGDDDDDDVDLFGSSDEEESEEKKRITEERSAQYLCLSK